MHRWERKGKWQGKPYTAITTDFDGVGELAEFTADPAHKPYWYGGGHSGNSYMPECIMPECIRMLRTGDNSLVEEAEKLLAVFATAGLLAPLTPTLTPSIVGDFPLVPAVLAGTPMTMLGRDTSEAMSERSPVNIMIDCGVMGNVSGGAMSQRGIALLVLVMALQTVRPVTLRLFDTMSWAGGHSWDTSRYVMWTVAVPTNPLHLAQLAWCLTSRGMACDLPFTHTNVVLKKPNVSGYGFAWRLNPADAEYEKQCREHWELAPTDLCFTGGSLEQGIEHDPMAWVQRQIDKLRLRNT